MRTSDITPATARHAAWYLREAWKRITEARPDPRTTSLAFEQVAAEVTRPCRAVGVARQVLRKHRYSLVGSIDELEAVAGWVKP